MSAAPDTFRMLHELLGGDEDARACRDIAEDACREQPRNFGIHVVSLSLTKMGDGIADAKLILSWPARCSAWGCTRYRPTTLDASASAIVWGWSLPGRGGGARAG